jgi:hypothetical protein
MSSSASFSVTYAKPVSVEEQEAFNTLKEAFITKLVLA